MFDIDLYCYFQWTNYNICEKNVIKVTNHLWSTCIHVCESFWYLQVYGTFFAADVKCYGNECYPLAFGIPAALMVLATSQYQPVTALQA